MKAVILAAGIASRLRPLTDNTPKCLLKVGAKNILELTIENLLANGVSDIVIVTGYLENMVKAFVNERFPRLKTAFIYNELFASTNNIFSLWLAKEALRGEAMLLLDSDIIFDGRIITDLLNSGFDSCLALKRHKVGDEEIKVKTGEKGRILEIGKTVKPSEAAGESIGIELFGKDPLAELLGILDHKITVEKNVNQFYEAAFQELINKNGGLYAVDVSQYYCMEIDTASDLETAVGLMAGKAARK